MYIYTYILIQYISYMPSLDSSYNPKLFNVRHAGPLDGKGQLARSIQHLASAMGELDNQH